MTCDLISTALTDEQKGQIYGILSVGCDRQTAANFVGCSLAAIRRAMQHDSAFAAEVCRAEAGAELSHMRTVQNAGKDEKNWRASVWWLERRAPERFGPRGPGVVTARQLKAFAEILADILQNDIADHDQRQHILGRLNAVVCSVDQIIRDAQLNLSDAELAADLQLATNACELADSPASDDVDMTGFGPS
jgi:hypothetical protein